MNKRNTVQEITKNYYHTTVKRSRERTLSHYEATAQQLERKLKPWLPTDPEASCLDLGCGCGELVYLLEKKGMVKTFGVDACEEEIQVAQQFVKGALKAGDVFKYLEKQPTESFTFVSALNFLEHFHKDALLELISQIMTILRPGGSFVAIVPNAISPFGGTTRYWDITHEWAFTPNNFHQLLALNDYKFRLDFREIIPRPHGLKSLIRYLAWQIIRTGIKARLLVETANIKGGIYSMDMAVRVTKLP